MNVIKILEFVANFLDPICKIATSFSTLKDSLTKISNWFSSKGSASGARTSTETIQNNVDNEINNIRKGIKSDDLSGVYRKHLEKAVDAIDNPYGNVVRNSDYVNKLLHECIAMDEVCAYSAKNGLSPNSPYTNAVLHEMGEKFAQSRVLTDTDLKKITKNAYLRIFSDQHPKLRQLPGFLCGFACGAFILFILTLSNRGWAELADAFYTSKDHIQRIGSMVISWLLPSPDLTASLGGNEDMLYFVTIAILILTGGMTIFSTLQNKLLYLIILFFALPWVLFVLTSFFALILSVKMLGFFILFEAAAIIGLVFFFLYHKSPKKD